MHVSVCSWGGGGVFGCRHLEQLLISIPPSHPAYKADFQIGNPCKVFRRQVIRGLSALCGLCVGVCVGGVCVCVHMQMEIMYIFFFFFYLVTMNCVSKQQTQ